MRSSLKALRYLPSKFISHALKNAVGCWILKSEINMDFYLLACGKQKRKCKKYGKRRGNKPSSFLHKIIILGFRRIYFKVAKKCQSLFICFQTCLLFPTSSFIYFKESFASFHAKEALKWEKENWFWMKLKSYLSISEMHLTILFSANFKVNIIINWPTKSSYNFMFNIPLIHLQFAVFSRRWMPKRLEKYLSNSAAVV